MFGLGVPELDVIAGATALLFGLKKLPEIGKNIGKTVKSFQHAAKESESELKTEPEDFVADSSSRVAMSKKEEDKTEVLSFSKENV
ncbi:Sec-independent protein translocase protein TATA [Cardamine amara subsp. amara]|uniref:Sec-independent protein translocase protein TATA n=1 Tax=Cardamine amara subsp. amara TaxID=228776 RepID=A0ABD1AEF1_CARAN